MAVIDRLILRLAAYELRYVADAPPAVVINEALELTRTFSGEEAVRFVNGILDGLARKSDVRHHKDHEAHEEHEGANDRVKVFYRRGRWTRRRPTIVLRDSTSSAVKTLIFVASWSSMESSEPYD
jgi:hypothetical protein